MRIFGCPIYFRKNKSVNSLYLTFDDGPHIIVTPQLLDLLDQYHAKATFFYTGKNIIKYRELAIEAHKRGHLIGNHSFSHPNLLKSNYQKNYSEIIKTKELIEDITNNNNKAFRPPYGFFSFSTLKVCNRLNLDLILWSKSSLDFKGESEMMIFHRVKNSVSSGNILLFHEGHFKKRELIYENSVKSIQLLLQYASNKNLKLNIL